MVLAIELQSNENYVIVEDEEVLYAVLQPSTKVIEFTFSHSLLKSLISHCGRLFDP